LVLALFPFLVLQGYWLAMLFAGAVGVGLAGIILISDVLISEVIDEDAARTGCRREGIYFGCNALVCRFAIGLEAASIGLIFAASGYSAQLVSQPPAVLWGLRSLLAGLPILALALAFALMWFYPLGSRQGPFSSLE
jgi:GPH family glycoside/pentoside/hexuronide:cation symporter